MNRRLYRSTDDRILAGVAGGMAATYDIDPALIRVGWVLLTIATGGVFLVVYIVMAFVVPLGPVGAVSAQAAPGPGQTPTPSTQGPPTPPPWQRRRPNRDRRSDATGAVVIGLLLILAGGYFLVRQFLPQLNLGLLWPVAVIALGGLLIFGAFLGRRDS